MYIYIVYSLVYIHINVSVPGLGNSGASGLRRLILAPATLLRRSQTLQLLLLGTCDAPATLAGRWYNCLPTQSVKI